MLTFEEKLELLSAFPELERHNVSLGRVNFHLEDSQYEKTTVIYHLHPNGNGFVYTKNLSEYESDKKGYTNIRDYDKAEFVKIVEASIQSLLTVEEEEEFEDAEQVWANEDGQTLTLLHEDDLWNVYAGENLDGTFTTYNQALAYLDEEGFTRKFY